ncbi:MAG: hypothetical protein NVSMB6_04280 [Burkholderiaceae bacterium]
MIDEIYWVKALPSRARPVAKRDILSTSETLGRIGERPLVPFTARLHAAAGPGIPHQRINGPAQVGTG